MRNRQINGQNCHNFIIDQHPNLQTLKVTHIFIYLQNYKHTYFVEGEQDINTWDHTWGSGHGSANSIMAFLSIYFLLFLSHF